MVLSMQENSMINTTAQKQKFGLLDGSWVDGLDLFKSIPNAHKVFMCGSRSFANVPFTRTGGLVMVMSKISLKLAELQEKHGDNLVLFIGDAPGADCTIASVAATGLGIKIIVFVPGEQYPRKEMLRIICKNDTVGWSGTGTFGYTSRDDYMIKHADEMFAIMLDNSKGTIRNINEWKKTKKPLHYISYGSTIKQTDECVTS